MEEKIKRRKYRDNPYTLIIDNDKFYIEFDSNVVEVSKEVFDIYNESGIHDINEMNEYDWHIYHYQEDGYLENLSNEDKLLEEIVEDNIDF